eukprot:TRINITY_DN19942_c0_g1_i1.p2 TRINITY_DN19942_c0_g1~~TRINITY_DN19942_c0_g1_i1.p2  ORF type:complete len:334 (-),score=42.36 TRINITY_DN19942_c0_g1_i1:1402-2367(-)
MPRQAQTNGDPTQDEGSRGTGTGGAAGTAAVQDHTQLALTFIEYLIKLQQLLKLRRVVDDQNEVGAYGKIRRRLNRLLKTSTEYDTALVLFRLRGTPLFEEQVHVHTRCGDYEAALEVLLLDLENDREAEDYCVSLYKTKIKKGENLDPPDPDLCLQYPSYPSFPHNPYLFGMVRLCLYPTREVSQERQSELRAAAIRVLNRHAAVLNPLDVLTILPGEVSVSEVQSFFVRSLRHSVHDRRQRRVEANIFMTEHRRAQLAWRLAQAKFINVTTGTRCADCGKLLMNNAPAVRPDGQIVHMACVKKSPEEEEEEDPLAEIPD